MNNIIYDSCKRTILRKNYPDNMKERLVAFLNKNLINKEQYDELLLLLEGGLND